MADLHVFRIEDGGENFWYVAEDLTEALNLYRTDPEIPPHARAGHIMVIQEPNDVLCAVILKKNEDPRILGKDDVLADIVKDEKNEVSLQTWKNWANERGKGFFACTV